MTFEDKVRKGITRIMEKRFGGQAKMATELDVSQSQLSKFVRGAQNTGIHFIAEIMDKIGATVVFPDEAKQPDTDPSADHPAPSALEQELLRNLRQSIPEASERLYASRIYPSLPKEQAVEKLRRILSGKKPLTIQEYYPIAAAVSDFKPGTLLDITAAEIVTRATQHQEEALELKESQSHRVAYGSNMVQEPPKH